MLKGGGRRVLLVFLVGLTAGVGGESLMFLQRQCERVEEALRDDFRVLLFLRQEIEPAKEKVLEEQLRAMPEVEAVRGVSRREAMAELRRADPELVASVVALEDNPLRPAFELRPSEAGLSRVDEWLAQASGLADWADVRYKPGEVEAILRVQFYARSLGLAQSALVCLVAAMALVALWSVGRRARRWGRRELADAALWAAASALGGAVGATGVFLLVLPLRQLCAWWSWPGAAAQAALLAAAALAGWALGEAPET